jgi:hypothetical protein
MPTLADLFTFGAPQSQERRFTLGDLLRAPSGVLSEQPGVLSQNANAATTMNALMMAKALRQREDQFQAGIRATPWFSEFVKQYGEEPDLNTPDYNYRAAWGAGIRPVRYEHDGGRYHWPSSLPNGQMLKSANHPTAWKEYYMRATGKNPDDVGATEADWLRMSGAAR